MTIRLNPAVLARVIVAPGLSFIALQINGTAEASAANGIMPRVPVRERTYRTEAIVLRRKDFGEADRMLTLFTPERGKLRVVAKGIRKPRSRKAGHLELFTCSRLLLAKGRDLDVITQAETVNAYRPLREDLLRGAYAAYAVELLDRFMPDEQENSELYALLRGALGWICVSPNLALTARYYELQLLSLAGFQPELRQCVAGGEKIVAEDHYFSRRRRGGVRQVRLRRPQPSADIDQRAQAAALLSGARLRLCHRGPCAAGGRGRAGTHSTGVHHSPA